MPVVPVSLTTVKYHPVVEQMYSGKCPVENSMPGRTHSTPLAGFRLLLLLCLITLSQAALTRPAAGEKTLQRSADPVIITGDDLPQLIGKHIDNIRVFSFRDGVMVPIPFQIDQRDSTGCWVWDVIYRQPFQFDMEDPSAITLRKPFAHGPGTVDDEDPAGTPLLDANDELVLMARDLGDFNTSPYSDSKAAVMLQVKISDTANGTHGWATIAGYQDSPPPRPGTRYMEYDTDDRTVRSPIYHFHYSDKHAALIHDLEVYGTPIIDRIRIKGEITLSLPFIDGTIGFDEKTILGYTQGYIAGPVRIIKRNIAHLSILGGLLNTPEVTCDHFYYAQHAEIPVCLSIRFPVKQVSMALTADYRDSAFNNLYMGDTNESSQTHGYSSPLLSHLHQLGTKWIAFDSEAASIISILVVPDTLEGQVHVQPCRCRTQQGTVPATKSSGTPTEAGFLITSTAESPKGDHIIYGTYLISARPYEPGDEESALEMQYNKLTVTVLPLPLQSE